MTQRIFDVENEKDMADLWDIIPENIIRIRKAYKSEEGYYYNFYDTKNITCIYETAFLLIDWHDKTEITRPIQEATEDDIGKLCYFWEKNFYHYGILTSIGTDSGKVYYVYDDCLQCNHCRRLTKQEIEELC